MAVFFTSRGSFKNLERFLQTMMRGDIFKRLDAYAQRGVDALASSTPRDTGITAAEWGYEIGQQGGSYTITWTNRNQNKGVNIVIILQHGHGTGTGGYVAGRDFINPAIRPIFDEISDAVWKEVQNA